MGNKQPVPESKNLPVEDQLNIINVGRLEDQKDQKTLLRAIKLIDKKIKIKLLIIGNGSKLKGLNNFIYKTIQKNEKL